MLNSKQVKAAGNNKINMNRGSSYLDLSVVVINMNFELWLFYF